MQRVEVAWAHPFLCNSEPPCFSLRGLLFIRTSGSKAHGIRWHVVAISSPFQDGPRVLHPPFFLHLSSDLTGARVARNLSFSAVRWTSQAFLPPSCDGVISCGFSLLHIYWWEAKESRDAKDPLGHTESWGSSH